MSGGHERRAERGSTILLVLVMLVLIGGMAMALIFVSQGEMELGQADADHKTAYFLAESAAELARVQLTAADVDEDFTDELVAAAGDGAIDLDIDAVAPIRDSSGAMTGVAGTSNDVPVIPVTAARDGWFAAFLGNDPADGRQSLAENNGRVLLVGVGATADGAFEIVEQVVEVGSVLPVPPPATITLIGPQPGFDGGNSNAKDYIGDDCDGSGVPGLSVPIVGTTGPGQVADAAAGVNKPNTYTSSTSIGVDTVEDITDPSSPLLAASGLPTLDPSWQSCPDVARMISELRNQADVVCPSGAGCPIPAGTQQFTFVEGDLTLGPTANGVGILVVTGQLTMHGKSEWTGLIYVLGEGRFRRNGGGNGTISGATVVADVAGPDGVYGNGDDCSGGFDEVDYDQNGGGTGETLYCTNSILNATPKRPYRVVQFRQR